MKTFRVEQNFGDGCFGWIYVDSTNYNDIDKLKIEIITAQKKDFENRYSGFTGKAIERPTLKVSEYCRNNHRAVRGGIKFNVKWR